MSVALGPVNGLMVTQLLQPVPLFVLSGASGTPAACAACVAAVSATPPLQHLLLLLLLLSSFFLFSYTLFIDC